MGEDSGEKPIFVFRALKRQRLARQGIGGVRDLGFVCSVFTGSISLPGREGGVLSIKIGVTPCCWF